MLSWYYHVIALKLLCMLDLEERKKERAPEFLSNFKDILAIEGKEVKLRLRISGYPTPEVTWYFNGDKLVTTDYHHTTVNDEEVCLIIRIAHPEHSGKYTCCLRNKFGSTEATATLSVATKPEITGRFADQERYFGEMARFCCSYKGFPLPDVTWYRNKLPLTVSLSSAIVIRDNNDDACCGTIYCEKLMMTVIDRITVMNLEFNAEHTLLASNDSAGSSFRSLCSYYRIHKVPDPVCAFNTM